MNVIETKKMPIRSWLRTDIDDEQVIKTLEQARILAESPAVSHPVALMADAHPGKGSTVGSVIVTENAIIPAAVGVDLGCFVGDTKIPLLNGTQSTLKDLTDRGEMIWVYSLNEEGKIVPGRAIALKTRENAPLVKVVVSGGEEIICTPDHLFMLRDGSYREAKDLQFNESLMPLYRTWQARDGYESCSTGKGTSRLTHQLVYEYFHGSDLTDEELIHHKNHFHFDNSPENLEKVDKSVHSRYHRLNGHKLANGNSEFEEKKLAGIRKMWEDPTKAATRIAATTKNITDYMQTRPEHFRDAVKDNGKRGAKHLAKFNVTPRECSDCDEVSPNPAALRWHKEREHSYNHKVLSVTPLDYTEDVYCLQVEKYHNFALAAGVFVHNCGMVAAMTDLTASDLPDNLSSFMRDVRETVPAGVGKGHLEPTTLGVNWLRSQDTARHPTWELLDEKQKQTAVGQVGSLGSGNHFFEICLDEDDNVWLLIHSGSRGIGNQLATKHIKVARQLERAHELEDIDLAYFVENTPEFEAYITDMLWAQDYAFVNRDIMMTRAFRAFQKFIGKTCMRIHQYSCHHNYADRETIVDDKGQRKIAWVTRKGAISAREGQYGIIPGSMGTRSYIVRGLGNPASYYSSAHGAGRRLSRNAARKSISLDEFRAAMGDGRIWQDRDAQQLLDEAPQSYKSIDLVIADQSDLVEVVHTLRAILNYKGVK